LSLLSISSGFERFRNSLKETALRRIKKQLSFAREKPRRNGRKSIVRRNSLAQTENSSSF